MFRREWMKRWLIPMGGVLLLLGGWAIHSSMKGVPGRARESAAAGPRDRNSAPGPRRELSPGPVSTLGQAPSAIQNSPSTKPLDAIERRKLVEESLSDCRLALICHEQALGEKAYRTLLRYRGLALACARMFLKEAKDPADREALERAVVLLSLPPTHGMLKHFEW